MLLPDTLPITAWDDADAILLRAGLPGQGRVTWPGCQSRCGRCWPGSDGRSPGFDDRQLRLAATLGGARPNRRRPDPGCATALQAILDAMGKKTWPEDTRTGAQRRHDVLAEACRRLVGDALEQLLQLGGRYASVSQDAA